jgi:hypothetical protein
VLGEPLDALDPSCYNKVYDVIDNIDEFIHVGRCKWDVICLDRDLAYNIEGHFQLLSLQLPYVIVTDSDVWKNEYDMVIYLFQPPMDSLLQHSHDDFQSYLGGFDTYSFYHLDYSTKKIFNHCCALVLIKVRTWFSQSKIFVTRVFRFLLFQLFIHL